MIKEEDKCVRAKSCHGVVQGKLQRRLEWGASAKEGKEECTVLWLKRRGGCTGTGQDDVVLLCCKKRAGFGMGEVQPKKGKTNGVSLLSNTC